MTEHVKTKHEIQELKYKDFNSLIDSCLISDEDKQILRMIYVEDKSLSFIGDTLGYAESTIKSRHQKLLKRLRKIL